MSISVLVIDDSKSSRKLNLAYVQDLLPADTCCFEAAGGAEGLAILQAETIDLVLLDLTMPNMSGYEVLAEMGRLNLTPRVIVISADVQRRTRERVTALGAAGFLEKPLQRDALQALLSEMGAMHD
ncbi:MAG TPA: response regulator [Burkholderiaceae bacterium]